jgi:O-antigen/teichoic acid export membrane protein
MSIIDFCQQAIYHFDEIVVGFLISAVAVTFYTIGGGLITYVRQIVASLTMTLTPLASYFEAEGRNRRVHSMLIGGTRASLMIALPIEIVLFTRGHSFISLWMGPQYAAVSARVLQILLFASILRCANSSSEDIVYGLGKHRPLAAWFAAEAVSNVALSVLLARWLGIFGVAWGTVFPTLFTNLVLWPRYIAKTLEIPLGHFCWQSWGRPVLAAVPFAAACCLADRLWQPSAMLPFFLQIGAILPIFIISNALVFRSEVVCWLKTRRAHAQTTVLEADITG